MECSQQFLENLQESLNLYFSCLSLSKKVMANKMSMGTHHKFLERRGFFAFGRFFSRDGFSLESVFVVFSHKYV